MFNIGPAELIVILLVALVILGPDKLPEMARTVGKGMRELRKATEDLKDQVETEFYAIDAQPKVKPPPGPRMTQEEAPPALPSAARPAEPAEPAEPVVDPPSAPGAPPADEPKHG